MSPIKAAWTDWQKAQRMDDELQRHTTWAAFLLLVIDNLERERAARAAGAVLTVK